MTAPYLRQFTRHSDRLLYWSERSGTPQAYLGNLQSGESEQLTDVAALDPASLSLSPDDRSFFYFDGPVLYEGALAKPIARQIYRVADGAVRSGFTADSGGAILFVERTGTRTTFVRIQKGQAHRAFETAGPVEDPLARPGNPKSRLRLLWRQSGALWIGGLDGRDRHQPKIAPGRTGQAIWIPSGATFVYLHLPDNPKELITLREHNPDSGADTLLARTSQYISAEPNANASVFVAASRSIASPYVLILLRAGRRELTLAEHHASDAGMVNPVFTPDSRNVLFVSDREGNPAVYTMNVERFVEDTGGDDGPDASPPEAATSRQ